MSDSSDEDVPPPLANIPQQVEALEKQLITNAQNKSKIVNSIRQEQGLLKKGFLCQKNSKKNPDKDAADEVPIIRPTTKAKNQSVPSFLRLPAVEEYTQLKNDLISKLSPTQETVECIQRDPFLAQAFMDPEIMMAVGEVASDPGAIKKYKNNKKVVKFYEAFGKIVGKQLQVDETQ